VTESDQERNSLQISSSLFGMFGMLLGFIIPDLFRPKAGTSPSLLPLQMSMIVVAVVCAVFIIITTYVVKERREFYEGDKPLPLGKALKTSLPSRSFQILVAQNFMSILVSSLVVGSVFYLADYLVPVPTMVLLACIFVPLLIGIPLTTVLRARLGVVGAQQLLLLTAGVGLLLIVVAPPPMIPVCLALAGLGLAGPQTLTNVLFAQVIDENEIRSGVRHEGAFFGINALVTKPAQSIAIALSPFILALTHFVTRDLDRAQPGDLLFYRQESGHMPFHSMIYLGESQIGKGAGRYLVYHTGPDADSPGEIRRPTLDELRHFPEPDWRPLPDNPRFLGVFRWNILRGAS